MKKIIGIILLGMSCVLFILLILITIFESRLDFWITSVGFTVSGYGSIVAFAFSWVMLKHHKSKE